MVDYNQILSAVNEVYHRHCEPEMDMDTPLKFPFSRAYRGQSHAIEQIIANEQCILCSHTGSGKTAVFLTAAHQLHVPTIVIEPRKFLQVQTSTYFQDFVMFGKPNYRCRFAETAATAPCIKLYKKPSGKGFFFKLPTTKEPIDYPCEKCQYQSAKQIALSTLINNNVLIVNFGNFYEYLPLCQFVIVDEADEFFRAISTPISLHSQHPSSASPREILEDEIATAQKEIMDMEINTDDDIKKVNLLQNRLRKLQFFHSHADICFHYSKKSAHAPRVFVELLPHKIDILVHRLFHGKRLCLVTATPPSQLQMPTIEYHVPMRACIYYTPVGLMTSRNVFTMHNEHLLIDAAFVISNIYSIFAANFTTNKAVIHCGNLSRHGTILNAELQRLHHKTILHHEGKLKETVDNFVSQNQLQFLLVVSAEYGFDFKNIALQFILKVPYATMDERLRALERTIGKSEFKNWYSMDALNRMVQQCGRVARGADGFGCTFILDEKFIHLYRMYHHLLPLWFKQRLDYEKDE